MESSPSKAYFEEEVELEKAARSALVGELSERTEPTKFSKYLNKLHERDANDGMTPRARHNVCHKEPLCGRSTADVLIQPV